MQLMLQLLWHKALDMAGILKQALQGESCASGHLQPRQQHAMVHDTMYCQANWSRFIQHTLTHSLMAR